MDANTKLDAKKIVNDNIKEILNLYGNFHLSRLLNDLVAIGTWPAPEGPLTKKMKSDALIEGTKIDTVPLPELKKILTSLMKISGDGPLKDLLH
jgi:hypothetical protein